MVFHILKFSSKSYRKRDKSFTSFGYFPRSHAGWEQGFLHNMARTEEKATIGGGPHVAEPR